MIEIHCILSSACKQNDISLSIWNNFIKSIDILIKVGLSGLKTFSRLSQTASVCRWKSFIWWCACPLHSAVQFFCVLKRLTTFLRIRLIRKESTRWWKAANPMQEMNARLITHVQFSDAFHSQAAQKTYFELRKMPPRLISELIGSTGIDGVSDVVWQLKPKTDWKIDHSASISILSSQNNCSQLWRSATTCSSSEKSVPQIPPAEGKHRTRERGGVKHRWLARLAPIFKTSIVTSIKES